MTDINSMQTSVEQPIASLPESTKMCLVIASDTYLPRRDGITRFLEEVIPRLQKNFDITVIAPDFKDKNVNTPGVTFVRIPFSRVSFGDFKTARFKPLKIAKTIKNADIVFSQGIGPIGGLALLLAQRFKKKTVSYIHSVDWELFSKAVEAKLLKRYSYPIGKWLARSLYGRCTHLIVPSERIADILTWKNIMTPKAIINLGVDTTHFHPLEDETARMRGREALGIEPHHTVIGYHGRISREKDILTLVRAFVKLRSNHHNLRLLIIGSGLSDIVKRLEKQPGVIYMPAVPDVEKYLPLMDIYCLSSLTETTSLGLLEAMSTELPVVTTPVGFIKDYVTHGKNGLFFLPGDSYSLMRELEHLLKDKELQKKLGANARYTVVHRFDWDLTSMRLVDFFERRFAKK